MPPTSRTPNCSFFGNTRLASSASSLSLLSSLCCRSLVGSEKFVCYHYFGLAGWFTTYLSYLTSCDVGRCRAMTMSLRRSHAMWQDDSGLWFCYSMLLLLDTNIFCGALAVVLKTPQNAAKRRKTPQNATKRRKTPQNAPKRHKYRELGISLRRTKYLGGLKIPAPFSGLLKLIMDQNWGAPAPFPP